MATIRSNPGAALLFSVSVVARLPLAMLSIALLVHAERLTGSFAVAGIVTAAYAISLGAGGPLLGRLADRRGQPAVLAGGSVAAAALLGAVAVLPDGTPPALLVALAAGIGFCTPPLGACVRALVPDLVEDPDEVGAVYALDASAVELTWIAGPPLALALGAAWSTGAALAVAGAVLLAATATFAAQPASRAWRPAPAGTRQRGGALRAPAMRTLVLVLTAVGVVFGAVEIGVASSTEALGASASAGPLLGLWGAGSLAGGLITARLGGGARSASGLALVLAALAAGHLSLVAAGGAVVTLAAALFVAGAAIAPTFASVYALAERAAPAGTLTEAFAWLATASAVGAAAGAAAGGALAEHAGPGAPFVVAGGAGAVALLAIVLRAATVGRAGAAGAAAVAAA